MAFIRDAQWPFNLYACAIVERWLEERIQGIEEVGKCVLSKLDKPLFRRNTRGASITEYQFAVVLVCT